MSTGLHIQVIKEGFEQNKFDAVYGCLTLLRAGTFKILVEEYEAEYKKRALEFEKDGKFAQQKWKERSDAGWSKEKLDENWKANEVQRDAKKKDSLDAMHLKYKDVNWVWVVAPKQLTSAELSHNQSFSKGITQNGRYTITFPKILEGGGMAYLEAFQAEEGARGKKPFGILVKATGTPRIVRVEWTDFDYNLLENKLVAFNSEVLLHIYTEALYGQELEINLFDEDIFNDDGLNIAKGNSFRREVNIEKVHPKEIGKKGVADNLIKSDQSATDNAIEREQYIQKVTIEVKVDYAWMKSAGEHLKIYPTVKSLKTGKYYENFSREFLEVCSRDGVLYDVQKEVTNKPVVVSEIETNVAAYSPCRYDQILLTDPQNKVADQQLYNSADKLAIDSLTYNCFASSDDDNPNILELKYNGYSVLECIQKNEHKKQGRFIFDNKIEIITAENDQYKLKIEGNGNRGLIRTNPELFFFSPDKINKYQFVANTCAQPNQVININVYPVVEREVAFVLTLFKTLNAEINPKFSTREKLTDYNKKKSMRLIRDELEILYQTKGGLGFGLSAKIKVDSVESSVELGHTKNQIKKLIGFYNKVNEVLAPFDGRDKVSDSIAYQKKILPKVTFDLEPPNLALALRITNKKIEGTGDIVWQLTGAIALKPIAKFKIGVDLMTLLQYAGVGGKIADWIKEKLENRYNFTIYVIFEVSLEAKGELTLTYNRVEGFAPGPRKLQVEPAIAIKGGVKSTEFVTVMVPEADGKLQSAKVEKYKAEASGVSSILYTYEVTSDSKGQYSQHKLEFTGLKATIIVYAIKDGMKYNETFRRDFTIIEKPVDPWYKSDKDYTV
ncbi:hypothetical protein PQ459_13500 [Chryseobacterium sp. KACC 21268]|nr:hypothetical protein PQ459_13500 [Chryseobacterium sp. KACC 21268]